MKKMHIFLMFYILFSFCGILRPSFADGEEDFTDEGNSTASAKNYPCAIANEAQKINKLAFDLYKSIRAEGEGENLVYSPYYLYRILGDLQFCFEGDLSEQIAKVLQNSAIDNREFLKSLENKDYLKSASALWIDSAKALDSDFLKLVSEKLALEVLPENFIDKSLLRGKIRAWVKSKADIYAGKESLIESMDFNPDMGALLLSVSKFESDWETPFNKSETKLGTFIYGEKLSQTAKINFMHRKGGDIAYASNERFQFGALNYAGGKYSIIFAKAKQGADVDSLSQADFEEMQKELTKSEGEVEIYLPKFTFKSTLEYVPSLKKLGLDLDRFHKTKLYLANDAMLRIDNFLSDTRIEMDEKSTRVVNEIIVSSLYGIGDSLPKPAPVLNLNEPFMFFIVENESGAIIHMGKFCNPILINR